ncbi:polysaccharide deacetylase family protein [Bailinhaonella thermotolerans]|nr:polysaccharide deacetylase family protein [Bailinhaonella thermotolerans]
MSRKPLIWMYHSIDEYDHDPHKVTVTPDRFDRQLTWLRRRGLRGVSMRELLAAPSPRGLVGLTFDDGYADFAATAVPILARHGFTATVFALPGLFGGHNRWDDPAPRKDLMTAEQVREVADAGMEVASHGMTHVALPAVDDAALKEEVTRSRELLAEVVGGPVDGFAYAYGALGDREVAAVREAGYAYAVATWPTARDDPHALPRTYIGDTTGPLMLRVREARHRLVWR